MARTLTVARAYSTATPFQIAASVDFEDVEAREIVKNAAFQWSAGRKTWTLEVSREGGQAVLTVLFAQGFRLTAGSAYDLTSQAEFIGLTGEIPVELFGTREMEDGKRSAGYLFAVDPKIEHRQNGTMVKAPKKVQA